MNAIGVLELISIARGFEAADDMVKAAEVSLIIAKPVCPGKFLIVVEGEVAAVSSAISAGRDKVGVFFVDELILPNIHPEVIPALYGVSEMKPPGALGIVETFSVAAAVEAADAGVKTAAVDLLELRLAIGMGGKSFLVFSGQISSVKAAVEAGCALVAQKGLLTASSLIPAPDVQIKRLLAGLD